jgi:hypothetical protein
VAPQHLGLFCFAALTAFFSTLLAMALAPPIIHGVAWMAHVSTGGQALSLLGTIVIVAAILAPKSTWVQKGNRYDDASS